MRFVREGHGMALAVLLVAAGSSSCTSGTRTTATLPTPSIAIHSVVEAGSPGPEGGAPNASCGVASVADVVRSFGAGHVAATAGPTAIGQALCRFTMTSSNLSAPGVVLITLTTNLPASEFATATRATLHASPIRGVGDRAFYLPNTQTLQLFKGTNRVIIEAAIRVPGETVPYPMRLRHDVIMLARSVAARL